MKKIPSFLLILIIALTSAAPAFAQAFGSPLAFLERSAIRQYERGDMESAAKQFGWILRVDPGNATANDYIKKLGNKTTAASVPAPERMNQVIADISSARQELIAYEQDTRELERLIRDLITENDALYQTLYKRSREVAEMREKFYGTPYAEAYTEAMKALPIDRVPQRLHPSHDILPEDTAALTRASTHEIDGLMQDIATLEASAATPTVSTSPDKEQLNNVLQAKRDILLQKMATLSEKQNSLDQLKNELLSINQGLKAGHSGYVEAIRRMDAYYSRLKERMARKNYTDQKMFSELVTDYASKLREIEELKRSVRTKDNALTSFKPEISRNNERLSGIDADLSIKDDEIARFKKLLSEYKQQLLVQEKIIKEQQVDISMTDEKLDAVSTQVTDIEQRLGTPAGGKNNNALLQKIDLQARHIKDLETQNSNIAAFLEKNEKAMQEAAIHIRSLEEQLVAVSTELKGPLSPINDQEKQALKEEVARLKKAAEQARQDSLASIASVNNLTIREQKLLAKIEDYNDLVKKIKDLELQIKTSEVETAARFEAEAAKKIPLQNENSQLRQKLLDASNQLTERSKELTNRSKELVEASKKIKALQEGSVAKDTRIGELSKDLALMRHELRSLRPVTAAVKASDSTAVADLEKRLRAAYEKLTSAETKETRAVLQVTELKDLLAERDAEIETLKASPSIKGNAEKKVLLDAIVSKDEELTIIRAQMAELQAARDNARQNTASDDQELLQTKQLAQEQSEQIKALTKENNALRLEAQNITSAPTEKDHTEALLKLTLDLKEKDARIGTLQTELHTAQGSVQDAEAKVKAVEEKYASLEIKQEAIDQIMNDREMKIARLTIDIQDLKEELTKLKEAQKEQTAKTNDAVKAVVEKKDREHDITLRELRRLNDLAEKKQKELEALERRLRACAKK